MSRRHMTTGRMPPGLHDDAASGARPILPESPVKKKGAAHPARGKTSRQDMPRTQKKLWRADYRAALAISTTLAKSSLW